MIRKSIRGIAAACVALSACSIAFAATQVIKGTVVESPAGSASVRVRVGTKVVTVKRNGNTVITRGEAGQQSRAVALREFTAGDQFTAIVEDGAAVSMKATYEVPKPVGPLKISSVTFSAPVPMKAGDIITVDMAGTPHAKASFAVKGFISPVQMKELSSGAYHGSVKVPQNKFVRNAPLVGYLGYGDKNAPPVQASRLVTVQPAGKLLPTLPPLGFVKPGPEPSKLPTVQQPAPIAKSEPKPQPVAVAPAPAPAPAPVEKPKPNKIVLTSPTDGATLRRAIIVKGTADPSSDVRITVTYSNGRNGFLKLSGEVATQNVSVGKDGEFRMGPIALDGPLATTGLIFTIKAYYPDRADHGTAQVTVIGGRD